MSIEQEQRMVFYKGQPLDFVEMPMKLDGKPYATDQIYFLPKSDTPEDFVDQLQDLAASELDILSIMYDVELRSKIDVISSRKLKVAKDRPIEVKYNLEHLPLPLTITASTSGNVNLEIKYEPDGPTMADWWYSKDGILTIVINGQDKEPKDMYEYLDYEKEMVDKYLIKHPQANENEIESHKDKLMSKWDRLYNVPQTIAEVVVEDIGPVIKFYESRDHEYKQKPTKIERLVIGHEYDFFGEKFLFDGDHQFGVFKSKRVDGTEKTLRFPLSIDPETNTDIRNPNNNNWINIPFAEQFKVTIINSDNKNQP